MDGIAKQCPSVRVAEWNVRGRYKFENETMREDEDLLKNLPVDDNVESYTPSLSLLYSPPSVRLIVHRLPATREPRLFFVFH